MEDAEKIKIDYLDDDDFPNWTDHLLSSSLQESLHISRKRNFLALQKSLRKSLRRHKWKRFLNWLFFWRKKT